MKSVWTKANEVDSYNEEEEVTMFVKRKLFIARVSSVSAKQALVTYVNEDTGEDEMILRRQYALRPAESLSLRNFRDESFRIPLPRKAIDLARHLEEGDVIQIVQATVTYAADGTSEDVLLRAPLISGRLNREKVKTCEVVVEDNLPVKFDEILETCEASSADATCKATTAAADEVDDDDTVSTVTETVDGEQNDVIGNSEIEPEEMKAHESHDCDDLGERVYAQMDSIICKLTGMFLENEREQVEAVICDKFTLREGMIRALQHLNEAEKEEQLPTSEVKTQLDTPTRAPVVQPPKTKTKQDWKDLRRKLRGEPQCTERASNVKREKVSKAPEEFEQKSELSKLHRADTRTMKSLEIPSLLKPIHGGDDGWKTVTSKKPKRRYLKLRIEDLRAGDEYVGEVTDAFNFGCFINFGCEKEGLMRYAHPRSKSVGPKDRFGVKRGQKMKVRVFNADSCRRRINLDFVHYA
eukprot:jgi/Bigna1/85363/estExt_fgenesh1_pg.C_30356